MRTGPRQQTPDADELHRLYITEEMSTPEIGEQFNVSSQSVRKWLKAVGIELRFHQHTERTRERMKHPHKLSKRPGEARTARAKARALLEEDTCTRCGETKPTSEFTKNTKSPAGILRICRMCHAVQQQTWRKSSPARIQEVRARNRRYSRARKFGLTIDDYDTMWIAQGGKCLLCGLAPSASCASDAGRALYIDHDHNTGAVRGLLCSPCNAMLGNAKDSPALLRAAADYLEAHAVSPTAADRR